MSRRPPLPPGPYLVVGMARSGVAALHTLRALGETAIGVDAGHPDVALGGVHLDHDGLALLDDVAAVVKSPGVPPRAPVIAAARRRDIPVLGELELAWRLLPNRFLAVTGTNGKTTTVELIGHVYREAGIPAVVAGNVGTPLSSLVGELRPGTLVVCEASSYQLADAPAFAPETAVLLNIRPDHEAWHGSFEAYRAAKLGLFAHQRPEDVAIADPGQELPGTARRLPPADLTGWDVGLRGEHNRANAAFAAAACLADGVPEEAVRAGLRTFGGVEHRLEELGEIDGVLYVNDSKATNDDSTLTALAAFADRRVHLILGGEAKGTDHEALRTAAAACAGVYLIGRDGRSLADGRWCETLERAVEAAATAAASGDVLMLSPACASFDQYTDYEERGRRFKELFARRRT